MASSATPLVAGTASVGTDNGKYAREGHVHPAQTSVSGSSGSCTGNAATATKLETARTIALTGAVTGSVTFDGSGDATIATTAGSVGNYDAAHSFAASGNPDWATSTFIRSKTTTGFVTQVRQEQQYLNWIAIGY